MSQQRMAGLRIVKYAEAVASGRPFRYVGSDDLPGTSHAVATGHLWRRDSRKKLTGANEIIYKAMVVCVTCDETLGIPKNYTDTYVIRRDEDGYEQDARDVLTRLGVRVRVCDKETSIP